MSEDQSEVTHVHRPVNRLTVICNYHYESEGEQPQTIPLNYCVSRELGEDIYSRKITVGEEPIPIDYGFVGPDRVETLIIDNLVGRDRQVNPTPAEAAADEAKVIELSNGILVKPGRFQPIVVDDFGSLTIRCRSGQAKIRCHSIPR